MSNSESDSETAADTDDIRTALEITPEEARTGVQKRISVQRPNVCETCDGNGHPPDVPLTDCPECDGTGRIRHIQKTPLGTVEETDFCHVCNSDGSRAPKHCPDCDGRGSIQTDATLAVDVPAGIEDGQILRLTGDGTQYPAGEPNGHLLVTVTIDDSLVHRTDDQETKLLLEVLESIDDELRTQNRRLEEIDTKLEALGRAH